MKVLYCGTFVVYSITEITATISGTCLWYIPSSLITHAHAFIDQPLTGALLFISVHNAVTKEAVQNWGALCYQDKFLFSSPLPPVSFVMI